MIFTETKLKGAYIIDLEKHEDTRGFFARIYCRKEFAEHSLDTEISQQSLSYNKQKWTLRGLHFQAGDDAEVKVVRCILGKIFDVIVDIRPESPTCGEYVCSEISGDNHRAFYIPKGFAHGFVSLTDESLILYQMSAPHNPKNAMTIRWNDPEINIAWPEYVMNGGNIVVSDNDKHAPFWKDIRS